MINALTLHSCIASYVRFCLSGILVSLKFIVDKISSSVKLHFHNYYNYKC